MRASPSKSVILKKAFTAGVDSYNQEVTKGSSDTTFMSAGFFHGTKGKTKGIKASQYLHKINGNDHKALFLLLYCIIDSSSKSLATSIAEQLIQGSCMFTYGLSIDTPPLIPSLTSTYFTDEQISRHQVNALATAGSNDHSGVGHVDRRQLVLEIIKQQRRNMSEDQKNIFDSQVLRLKSNLRTTSSNEIDMDLLPPMELPNSFSR